MCGVASVMLCRGRRRTRKRRRRSIECGGGGGGGGCALEDAPLPKLSPTADLLHGGGGKGVAVAVHRKICRQRLTSFFLLEGIAAEQLEPIYVVSLTSFTAVAT